MSNVAFDQLCRRMELSDARAALEAYETAQTRTDLTAEDVDFLTRAVAATKKRIADAERNAHSLTS